MAERSILAEDNCEAVRYRIMNVSSGCVNTAVSLQFDTVLSSRGHKKVKVKRCDDISLFKSRSEWMATRNDIW